MQAIAARLQIVSGLPCTKNAICGKVNRLRKAGRLPPAAPRRASGPYKARQPRPVSEPAKPVIPPPVYVRSAMIRLPEPAPEMSRIRAPEISAPSNPAPGVLLMELRDHHCRWPLWGNTERPNVFTSRSCGERITGKGPYCAACSARNAPIAVPRRAGGGRGFVIGSITRTVLEH